MTERIGPGCTIERREAGTWRAVFAKDRRRARINLHTTDRIAAIAEARAMFKAWHRGTFDVEMLRAGVSMRSVQMMLGHDDITTTMIYTELTADDVLADAERVRLR